MSQTGSIPTVSIYGIPFSKLTMKETVQVLEEAVLSKQPHQVITANPIMVMAALENPAIMKVMKDAEMIVPDGTGVVWAANYCGDPVAERVPGFELLHELLRVGENYRWGVYLLGSTPEVIQETAVRLQQQYPAIRIVGYRDGFFGSAEDEQVVTSIRQAAPDLLFVARGADTQEPWIHKYKHSLQVPVMMGVGGSFDIISGKMKRAPKLFQKLRMEWFYRLLREPSRAGRMLALPKFAVKVMRDKENVTKVR
ncbi:N-acetylglucosaminyldiphosphoundecaprenol N-acetyl-beta-D-mannosaminyltransferase [Paenibacillus sp. 4624]|jgi:N-acetylglucosaminyldiphosphoundecaprenol N-acetyl-beta-D-mannosaminyltransferase|uniref:N-acetylglucosaminyldiphosphoundecaprenol N-acetyl-beta-D-mannosaminyltransferase n=1 Tax=Paenibacillus amylolyticus TaxID=1451 RepID=A0A5M9WVI6_PAEAM|nr:WecB/TagA/CpsF family glycosyltransferase [Paenibacillus amylolyticus]KAA8785552.1 WecB/TagA/CpsF family glycosyltransferase [Paenibacillus amylolyticus]